MNRRNFLKITMGALGSAMGVSAVKADVLQGVSLDLPKPVEPHDYCDFKTIWSDKLLEQIVEAGRMLDKQPVPKYGYWDGYEKA